MIIVLFSICIQLFLSTWNTIMSTKEKKKRCKFLLDFSWAVWNHFLSMHAKFTCTIALYIKGTKGYTGTESKDGTKQW